SAQDQGRKAESQAEIYKIDLEHANKVLSMQEDESEPAEVQEVVDVVTTAKIITEVVTAAASETITAASTTITAAEAQVPAAILTAAPVRVTAAPSRRRKEAVIRDPQEEYTTSTINPAETKSKDKGKRILVEEPKPLKKQQQIEQDKKYARELEAELNKNIDWDEVIDHVKRKAKEDPAVKKYQALKRKPQTEAQARKNMMLYLKNTKEQIEEEESRALKRINETPAERAAKRQKLDEEVEELKRHLQIMPNKDDDVYTEATPLARKVPVVDYEIINMNNKPYFKIIRADGTYQLYIITFTIIHLILLVERKYLLTRFTLDQMLNAVRLEVEEESEVSLELLSAAAGTRLKKWLNDIHYQVIRTNWRDLPMDISLVSVEVLRYDIKRSKCENAGIVPTEMELILEQTQQGISHEVSKDSILQVGNPVKKILLKLNLPDHRILKDGGEGT
nr:hypothetical protein [Tanacetum cinerariifolium]